MEDKKINFTHLHVHTEYSLLDGSAKIGELVKRALGLLTFIKHAKKKE